MTALRDTARLTRAAKILTWAWLASDVVLTASSLFTINVLGGMGGDIATIDALEKADHFSMITASLYMIAFIAAGMAILRWLYVTNKNAQQISDAPFAMTPGWSIGFFFIPIANLFKPFVAIRESWQATVDPQAPDTVIVPPLLRWWWGLWIATSILGNVQFRLSMSAKTPENLITAESLSVVALPVDIALTIVLVTIMNRLSRMQSAFSGTHSAASGPVDSIGTGGGDPID